MRELRDIDVEEVSFVDVPANKVKFKIIKRGEPFGNQDDSQKNKLQKEMKQQMDELIKIYKVVTDVELTEEEKEILKALSPEDLKKVQDAMAVLKKYKDELPDDLKKEIATLAKLAVGRYPYPYPYPPRGRYPYPYPYPVKKEDEKKEEEDVEKAGKKLSKDTLETIGKVIEILSKLLPENKEEKAEKKEVAKSKEDEKMTVNLNLDDTGLKEELEKVSKDIKDSFEKALVERDKKIEELGKGLENMGELSERLKKVEEVKGVKKSLEEEKDKDVKKKDVKWPSFEADEE